MVKHTDLMPGDTSSSAIELILGSDSMPADQEPKRQHASAAEDLDRRNELRRKRVSGEPLYDL